MPISPDAQDVIMQSFRPSTRLQYKTYLSKWETFAKERGEDQHAPTAEALVDFLFVLHKDGLGHSALCTARSAVASLCINGTHTIGNHPLVKRFLKGAFNVNPTLPKTSVVWDPSVVILYIKGKEQAEDLNLKDLTLKLTMLLALLSTQRIQTLALLNTDHLSLEKDKATFRVDKLLKQSRPGHHIGNIELSNYPHCRCLCVVTTLREYLRRTKVLRGDTKSLLLSYVKPHKAVCSATIGRWLKVILAKAGIDKHYSAHSTRKAASSKAAFCHVPIDSIMKSAGWSRASTFQRHYQKPITQFGSVGLALLDSAQGKIK